jgi:hypothetical protein
MDHAFERNPGIPLDLGWINSVQARRDMNSAPFSACDFHNFSGQSPFSPKAGGVLQGETVRICFACASQLLQHLRRNHPPSLPYMTFELQFHQERLASRMASSCCAVH